MIRVQNINRITFQQPVKESTPVSTSDVLPNSGLNMSSPWTDSNVSRNYAVSFKCSLPVVNLESPIIKLLATNRVEFAKAVKPFCVAEKTHLIEPLLAAKTANGEHLIQSAPNYLGVNNFQEIMATYDPAQHANFELLVKDGRISGTFFSDVLAELNNPQRKPIATQLLNDKRKLDGDVIVNTLLNYHPEIPSSPIRKRKRETLEEVIQSMTKTLKMVKESQPS